MATRLSPPERPHILFLYSDTGGGHRSAAEAIREALELEFPGQLDLEMVDILRKYTPPPFNFLPEIYPTLSRYPRLWKLGYQLSDGPYQSRMAYRSVWPYVRFRLKQLVVDHPHSLLVSVHQLINEPLGRLIKGRDQHFATVVTDMVSTHAAWFDRRASLVVVPTEAARKRALQLGLEPDRVQVTGMPVAQRFCLPSVDRSALRARLGWPQDQAVILLVGGGEGMGPLIPTALAIDAANLPATLVVVAGRNERARQQLENHAWQMPRRIYGFTREMPEMMRAADILVTKAGPGTISEAFIAGLPLVLFSRMPGQEDGNVTHVVKGGAGVWAPGPEQVTGVLRRWLENPAERQQAAECSLRLATPQATRHTARLLAELAMKSVAHDSGQRDP